MLNITAVYYRLYLLNSLSLYIYAPLQPRPQNQEHNNNNNNNNNNNYICCFKFMKSIPWCHKSVVPKPYY